MDVSEYASEEEECLSYTDSSQKRIHHIKEMRALVLLWRARLKPNYPDNVFDVMGVKRFLSMKNAIKLQPGSYTISRRLPTYNPPRKMVVGMTVNHVGQVPHQHKAVRTPNFFDSEDQKRKWKQDFEDRYFRLSVCHPSQEVVMLMDFVSFYIDLEMEIFAFRRVGMLIEAQKYLRYQKSAVEHNFLGCHPRLKPRFFRERLSKTADEKDADTVWNLDYLHLHWLFTVTKQVDSKEDSVWGLPYHQLHRLFNVPAPVVNGSVWDLEYMHLHRLFEVKKPVEAKVVADSVWGLQYHHLHRLFNDPAPVVNGTACDLDYMHLHRLFQLKQSVEVEDDTVWGLPYLHLHRLFKVMPPAVDVSISSLPFLNLGWLYKPKNPRDEDDLSSYHLSTLFNTKSEKTRKNKGIFKKFLRSLFCGSKRH